MTSRSSSAARIAILAMAMAAAHAQAQSSCSSDGQPRPVALVERFINADCESCWSDAQTHLVRRGELAIDWIVPSKRGADAPLSAGATRDAAERLAAAGKAVPASTETVVRNVMPQPGRLHRLRVARGPAVGGYMGASIELRPGAGGPWQAWLLLVEAIPAGTDGTPVARHLVRNALQSEWNIRRPQSKEEQARLIESRSMGIPQGADPKRLQVIGWVEDASGRVVAAAQSRCAGP